MYMTGEATVENRIDSTELEHKTEQATPGYKTELTTLCYIEKDGKYLLMHRNKKEKDINKKYVHRSRRTCNKGRISG